jgi:hypothetical protein
VRWRNREVRGTSFFLRTVALAGAVGLIGCGGAKTPVCVPSCLDTMSCRDSCGGMSCHCPEGDVCNSTAACVPCVVGSCKSSSACVDECGNADSSCATNCAQPDTCVDNCGVGNTAVCAGVECDSRSPGNCRDTCGLYAAKCCCVPTACSDAKRCVDDCGHFDPSACKGRMCGSPCQDTCGEPEAACWFSCPDPTGCHDDCGNVNPNACPPVCDPNKAGFDTCGNLSDGC